ncbi:biotin transporter BioY [uncultured Treponema sp.]|uniref:biotin transporter BioY n=1 Tax=uncultured Treponema sp. TaxID=162155 RepID=UPI0025D23F98|nr:biotin transporter BioY [uncultured Treponema sp.]
MQKRKYVFSALFAALISIGCVIAIPLPGGVPVTVQNMFSILAGAILGSFYGAVSVLIWLTIGAVGIPVFANAHGGIAIILGPTGGYMLGYALASLFLGLMLGKPNLTENKKDIKFLAKIAVFSLLAYALVYLPGIPWFMHVMAGKGKPVSFTAALKLTFIPFIPGDLIKWLVTIPLSAAIRPVAARYLESEN